MPYSKNADRVEQLLPWLSYLIEGRDCFWDLQGRAVSAETFAYRVREALHISRTATNDDGTFRFARLQEIADDVVVEVNGSQVVATFGKVLNVSLPAPISQLAEQSKSLNMYSAAKEISYSIDTIKMLWTKRQSDKVNLPMYTPNHETLTRIYEWAQSQDPRIMLMPADDALTLVVYDPDLEGIDWTPTDN